MVRGILAAHHVHKRKRIHKKLELFPHPKKFIRILDNIVLFGGLLIPLISMPQLIKIWIEQSAKDVSLISWTGYLIGATVFFIYGIAHKEKPLILVYGLSMLVDLSILISILIFGQGFL